MDKNKSNCCMKDISQTIMTLNESSALHSRVYTERSNNSDNDKSNDNLDYNAVIKQFDELISELSCARNLKDRTLTATKNLTLENEDFSLTKQNLKNENADYYIDSCNNDFSINRKKLPCNQPSKVVITQLEDKTLPVNLENKMYIPQIKQSYLNDITPSKNIFNGKSLSDSKHNMPWINSHLWDPEKRKESSMFCISDLEVNKKLTDFKKNIKGSYYNSPQFITTIPQITNNLDASYLMKQYHENLSSHKTGIKYSCKTASCGVNPLQERYMCHAELGVASASSFISRSHKASEPQRSKYILSSNCFLVKLYIETRDLHLGPFMFEVFPKMTLRLLKLKVEQEHGIISSSQRWILGKHFAVDNDKSLADYNVLPGSSIIVYVDTERKISNTLGSNEVFSKKVIAKNINSQVVIKKLKSGSCDNLNTIGKEVRELARKDSLDSKLAESGPKTDVEYHSDCSSCNTDHDGKDILLKGENIVTLASRTKVIKKDARFKRKTKVVVHDKNNLFQIDNKQNSILNSQNVNNLTKNSCDFADEVCNNKKQLSSSDQIRPVFEETSGKPELILLNPLQNNPVENETNLIDFNGKYCNKIEELNSTGICSVAKIGYNNTDFNVECNYAGKHVQEGYENVNLVDFENKMQEINVTDISKSNKFFTENHENIIQLHAYNIEKKEIVGSSCVNSDEKNKHKQSITSLIRKLSLTRKARSIDGNCSPKEISDKVQNDIKGGNDFSSHTTDQSISDDIHLEILPHDSSSISSKDECIMPQISEDLQTNVTDHVAESAKNFELLLEIENMDLVQNTFNFTCPVCFDEFESGQGVILHDCLHVFCRDCLINAVCYADGALVKCPYRDNFYACQSHLQQREIKALVSEELYEKYLQRSITTAEGLADRSFHCKTPDCKGWCVYENTINVFHCPVCSHYNCLNCQAIHEGLNCRQYQDKLKLQQKVDKESEKTLALLNEMINSGKALRCPKCDLILLKKWGCDWLKCSVCKTEICWITKGPRWGPGGQGDISGGCKCGVNGVKCHPSCTYCH